MSYYSALVLASNPVAYYRLGELTGTTAADSSGNGHPGTYTGGCTLGQPGAIANDSDTSVEFDGSTGYVAVPNYAGIYSASGSVELWIKTTTSDQSRLYNVSQASPPVDAVDCIITSGVIGVYFGVLGQGVNSATVVNDGNWHYFSITWSYNAGANQTTAIPYVDGVPSGTPLVATGTVVESASPTLTIAAGMATVVYQFLAGNLDEVASYSTALSPAVILAHYNAGKNGPPVKRGGGFGQWWSAAGDQ